MNTLSLTRENTFARDAILVVLSGLLITLMGQFSIPLPFTPVPITFRFQTILLLSVFLGSRRAALSVLVFLIQGPSVFTPSPVAGYLVGYLIAAFVVGMMSEKQSRASLSFLVGTLIVYTCGAAYLSTLIGFQKAILLGVLPFIAPDLLKTVACLKILAWYQRVCE